jgi:hypothetical protein
MTENQDERASPVTAEPLRTRDKPANVRATLAELVDQVTPERLQSWLDEALSAEKDACTTCQECHHRVPIKVADWANRAKVLEMFMNQGKGSPPKQAEPVRAGGKTTDLTDGELEQLLAQDQPA